MKTFSNFSNENYKKNFGSRKDLVQLMQFFSKNLNKQSCYKSDEGFGVLTANIVNILIKNCFR